jgi:hypothetical protein
VAVLVFMAEQDLQLVRLELQIKGTLEAILMEAPAMRRKEAVAVQRLLAVL